MNWSCKYEDLSNSDRLKKRYLRHGSGSKGGGGGVLGTGQDKKGGLYRGTYLYWTYYM